MTERYLFFELFGRLAALHGDWKLVGEIEDPDGKYREALPLVEETRFELYHLGQDIGETVDVARLHPEVYEDLRSRTIDWLKEVGG